MVSRRSWAAALDEEPVEDGQAGHDREAGEDEAAVGQVAAEAPESARCCRWCEVRGYRRRGASEASRAGRPRRRSSVLVARSKSAPPSASDQNRIQRLVGTFRSVRHAGLSSRRAQPMQMGRVGQGLEPLLGDRLATIGAVAVLAGVDSFEGLADLVERDLFVFDQAKREFLLEVLGAQVGQVQGHVGEVAGGVSGVALKRFGGHLFDVALEPGLKGFK